MELILISRNKLKVMLTAEDMSSYSLSCDSLDYDNTETRRAFWDILDSAKHKTGFDAAGNRVFIQVFPSKGGGCELFVTKLTKDDTDSELKDGSAVLSGTSDSISEEHCRVRLYAKSPRSISLSPRDDSFELYGFRTIDDLLAACSRLMISGCSGGGSAFFSNDKACYYLSLPEADLVRGASLLSEYGVRYSNPRLITVINEHCDCICRSGAVDALAKLASV